jgi:hypothetical protein
LSSPITANVPFAAAGRGCKGNQLKLTTKRRRKKKKKEKLLSPACYCKVLAVAYFIGLILFR